MSGMKPHFRSVENHKTEIRFVMKSEMFPV